jgi:hypothetical protein
MDYLVSDGWSLCSFSCNASELLAFTTVDNNDGLEYLK